MYLSQEKVPKFRGIPEIITKGDTKMSDHKLILGKASYDLFLKTKTKIGHPSDSVTLAELCWFYNRNIERIEKRKRHVKLKPVKGSREPFKKGEVVFVYLDNSLKRGIITGFTRTGNIHINLDNGGILERQSPEIIFHEWDVGYAPLPISLSTEAS